MISRRSIFGLFAGVSASVGSLFGTRAKALDITPEWDRAATVQWLGECEFRELAGRLDECNGLAMINDRWFPVRRDEAGTTYWSPQGLRLWVPFGPIEFRPMTPEQIVIDMASRREKAVFLFSPYDLEPPGGQHGASAPRAS